MSFDVWKVKLENQLTQATENDSEGSGSTRVMALTQLILHYGEFQKFSSSPFGEKKVCFLTKEALFTSETLVKSARPGGVTYKITVMCTAAAARI